MDHVILLSEDGTAIGSLPKSDVHTTSTPLHFAFSCHLQNEQGQILVTRRSLSKQTWPGVWTNSFCGHPRPDEAISEAIVRRAHQELGAEIVDLRPALPDYRYRAVDASGIVENEICPVYVARLSGALAPAPDEVSEWAWVDPSALADAVAATPFTFSPWLVEQLPLLRQIGAV